MTIAQPLGILGAANRRLPPGMRLGAFAFTAMSQTVRERDRQIAYRRVLSELAENRESRLEAWGQVPEWPWFLFGIHAAYQSLDKMWYKGGDNLVSVIDQWDKDEEHGEKEIKHRLDTLYSSQAIFFKSVIVGASLGTLPVFQRHLYGLWDYLIGFRSDIGRDVAYYTCALSDPGLHCLYTTVSGLPPRFPLDGFIVGMAHECAYQERTKNCNIFHSLHGWRASPRCWYSREGKLPLWQYDVERDPTLSEKNK